MDDLCVGPANTKKNLCTISKIKNRFIFADCVAICLICTARFMIYVSDYNVCLFHHPPIAVTDCISWWSTFNFGVNDGVILCRFVFQIALARQIRRNKNQPCVWMCRLILFATTVRKIIKGTVAAQKELGWSVAYGIFQKGK